MADGSRQIRWRPRTFSGKPWRASTLWRSVRLRSSSLPAVQTTESSAWHVSQHAATSVPSADLNADVPSSRPALFAYSGQTVSLFCQPVLPCSAPALRMKVLRDSEDESAAGIRKCFFQRRCDVAFWRQGSFPRSQLSARPESAPGLGLGSGTPSVFISWHCAKLCGLLLCAPPGADQDGPV